MDWIVSLAETYAALERKLLRTDPTLGTLLEPFSHVFEVESRRQQFRPTGQVRLLLIAESHVRMTDVAFRGGGCGFIYEPRYYTPWWQSLFLPAFGGDYLRRQIRSDASLRAMALRQLQEAGV